jgi:hypothetical protein
MNGSELDLKIVPHTGNDYRQKRYRISVSYHNETVYADNLLFVADGYKWIGGSVNEHENIVWDSTYAGAATFNFKDETYILKSFTNLNYVTGPEYNGFNAYIEKVVSLSVLIILLLYAMIGLCLELD